ncbi:MAG TPA: PTS sugar transporter subunit IIA [Phycisphaerae bacterium]|nr:PTS sugar transporter subunit IIA [Phycisphaerae bacterium]HRW53555.1 PTS sugar transporter subunit IIA [Phycisphaerae bacterium]
MKVATAMPKQFMDIDDVARSLHVSTREVLRLAEARILPASKVGNVWRFRTGEVWNWIEENMHSLSERRARDRHPELSSQMLISAALKEHGVIVDLDARTKSSILRELATLAENVDPYIDSAALYEGLDAREKEDSTALQDGVALPHPTRMQYSEGPIVVAARTLNGIYFGERGGGRTDLFFLVCCPDTKEHLLYFGRMCRLLIDSGLQERLRSAGDSAEFISHIETAERIVCGANE